MTPTPHYVDDTSTVWHGDCLDVLATLPDGSVDAVVTDPPAGIGFMGRTWDHHKGGRDQWSAWLTEVMAECYRVAKPGAHAFVWALPRTSHWTARGVKDAGWEIRDRVVHLFGTGFPKSHNLPGGLGTALKPAAEDWWLARKPLVGTVAGNVLAHGTGALNVDGCRVGFASAADEAESKGKNQHADFGTEAGGNAVYGDYSMVPRKNYNPPGRWPANVVLDETQAAALDTQSGESVSKRSAGRNGTAEQPGWGLAARSEDMDRGHDDQGGASRFFYTAKADAAERVRLPAAGGTSPNAANRRCATCKRSEITGTRCECAEPQWERETPGHVSHPTVKPLALMRWLVRLVCPSGGVVLEPFAGSGTTVEACILEGFRCIAIERELDYLPLILQRIHRRRDPVAAVLASGEDGGLFDLLDDEQGA